MIVTYVALLIFSVILSVKSDINISDDDYKLLPPIFHIDSYHKCIQKKNLFCRISLRLYPLTATPVTKFWKFIEKTKKSKELYRHDELFHAICIDEKYGKKIQVGHNVTALKEDISRFYTNKFKNKGLQAEVADMNCDKFRYRFGTFDLVLIWIIVLYLVFIIFATLYDTKIYKNHKLNNKYIVLFSLRYNLRKLARIWHQTERQKLKCIQGMRFYTTAMVIFCHTFCSFAGGYIENTTYLENISRNFFRHTLRILFVFLVQTFFLVSAWLLSYHTFKIFERREKINLLKYALLTFCNRYLRIIPPVLLMVSLGRSVWIYGMVSGPVTEIYSDKEYQRCQKNWWVIFFFLSNHYRQQDMCYFTTWYLSADTQLYVLSLICLVAILKFREKTIFIMATCLIISIAIPSVVTYIYDLDIIFRITPENSKNNMLFTFEFSASYSSTYSNMATYMLGLIFGYIYFRYEDRTVFTSKVSVILWWILSIGLPSIVLIISSYRYRRIPAVILAGILKPIYALGIGIGIFGMCKQVGGLYKQVCEWKPILFLGNFTYSTYVVHFGIVFYRTASTLAPMEVSDYILLTSFLQDTILSFMCGFFIHVVLEMPFSQLQRIFVPKFSIDIDNIEKNN